MIKTSLELKTINDLLGMKFFIPSYQRGYRWDTIQIEQLLTDLRDFTKKRKEEEYYCLQPIVVKRTQDNEYEVVDGQQRLTAIHVLLQYFNERFTEKYRKKLYSLEYETREDSKEFLNKIDLSKREDNVDYYYISVTYEFILNWFSDKQAEINDFESTILNWTKVIWYEAESDIDSIDIFTRINIGKIPLTNAELIKALLIQKSNFQESNFQESNIYFKQFQIATEWDIIEKKLQEDAFWYFIYDLKNRLKYKNRIEYIFDLITKKQDEHEAYYTFNEFYKEYMTTKKNGGTPDIDVIWREIKNYFQSFEEWFQDKEFYHLIGFLVDCGKNVNDLKDNGTGKTKTEYREYLKSEIKKEIKNGRTSKVTLEELEYGDKRIKKILLLFNIQTILSSKEADMRFPFYRYKDEQWDIEHIRSQTDAKIAGNTRKDWAEDVLEYLTGETEESNTIRESNEIKQKSTKSSDSPFVSKLQEILNSDKIDDPEFDKLYKEIVKHFKEDEEPDNKDAISNLALLDSRTNRSYKNAMFPIKRRKIIENDMHGVFVPICSKNVFLKLYSKKLENVMYWMKSDADDYLFAIKETLKDYIEKEGDNDEE